MTFSEELRLALEGLRGPGALVWMDDGISSTGPPALPLAALIEAANEIDDNHHSSWCPARYERPQGCTCGIHALRDALRQLVRAINGDSP